MTIGLKEILEARDRIGSTVFRTHLGFSRSCSELLGTKIHLKFENQQKTGSFKIRGALNKMMSLTSEERARGVVAASAGNHAQGVALAATTLGAKAKIVMPKFSPIVKIAATRSYGGEVILHGDMFDEAFQYAKELAQREGYVFVHPYDDPFVMAGQGTLGLEILEDLPDVESVVISIGGGGLISGVATAIKQKKPSCKIYGVVAANSPGMKMLFEKQDLKVHALPKSISTIADGIAVKNPSPSICENYLRKYVDEVVAVSEGEIAESIVYLLERAKTVVEGSGAVALAAARSGKLNLGASSCLVLSGGNIDVNLMAKVIEKGLNRTGRLARLSVVVDDRPGALHRLTGILAEKGANILEVEHERLGSRIDLRETGIDFLLETQNEAHLKEIVNALTSAGARFLNDPFEDTH